MHTIEITDMEEYGFVRVFFNGDWSGKVDVHYEDGGVRQHYELPARALIGPMEPGFEMPMSLPIRLWVNLIARCSRYKALADVQVAIEQVSMSVSVWR